VRIVDARQADAILRAMGAVAGADGAAAWTDADRVAIAAAAEHVLHRPSVDPARARGDHARRAP
jgi:hypothetical protein